MIYAFIRHKATTNATKIPQRFLLEKELAFPKYWAAAAFCLSCCLVRSRYMKVFLFVISLVASSTFVNGFKTIKIFATADPDWEVVADSVHKATFETFLSEDGQYMVKDNGGDQTFHYWWNAHVLDVLVDAHLRGQDQEAMMLTILKGIKSNNNDQFPIDYYDDMEWLALASLRAYHATGNQEFLEATNILWEDIKTGWNDYQGGGIAWRKNQLDYKNTPANAPAVILAARLYKELQDPDDLAWAKKIYQWQKSHLVDKKTGLVWDGVNRNGDQKIDKNWRFTYNQGVYIGAAMELYELTRDEVYLNDAIKTADFVISDDHLAPAGILKSEGGGDGGLFKGILVRYMTEMILSGHLPEERKPAYSRFLRNNAISLYHHIKRPQMLVGPAWNKEADDVIDASIQLSGLMLLEAMAK
jgi:predicted alpha-1,6-mannanase (GH76 family)